MKVLLDEGMNPRLRTFLQHAHEVHHTVYLGWAALKDSLLLQAAENADYEVLVTTDKRMVNQQNNATRRISLLVLPANDTGWIRRAHKRIARAVEASTLGSYEELAWNEPLETDD